MPTVPQPVAADTLVSSDAGSVRPTEPRAIAITQLMASGVLERAVVYKRTYEFVPNHACRVAEEQEPLCEDAVAYEPLDGSTTPSFRALPEIFGYRAGTDVVVQGNAYAPAAGSTEMTAAVWIGAHRHAAVVLGRRVCDVIAGRVVFTPPQPFEVVPLRYEHAYGGRDLAYEKALMREVERITPADQLRRNRAWSSAMLGANHPLMYPRNRFGKGYVLDTGPAAVVGRELPHLERPEDRLTPERLVLENPLGWARMPLPVGFDYLDPLSFPRSAMLGLPPTSRDSLTEVAEVEVGLIPSDFYRGNVFAGTPEQIVNTIHPCASRSASLGLWMPLLQGGELMQLEGMAAQHPAFRIEVPREWPEFALPGRPRSAPGGTVELHEVRVDVERRRLTMIWAERLATPRPLLPGEDVALAAATTVHMRQR